jgi:hypothetical protein
MRRLAEPAPHPLFHFLDLGQGALLQGDFKAAKVARLDPYRQP